MLSQFLSVESSREHVGQLILLSDVITDGSFLLHHFVCQALKAGQRTVLLSLSQALLHYSCVCSKLGVNLHAKTEQGHFVFLDGLTSLLSELFPPAHPAAESSTPAPRRPHIAFGSDWCLRHVFEHVEDVVLREGEKDREEPVCLVIDALSVLLSVGVALSDVVVLIQQCLHLLASPEGPCKGRGYVVVMVHQEEEGKGEEDLLHKHLLHLSHLHLQARGLTTGYSKDIDGELTATWRDPACTGQKLPVQQSAHYKLADKTVKIFPKGLIKGVL